MIIYDLVAPVRQAVPLAALGLLPFLQLFRDLNRNNILFGRDNGHNSGHNWGYPNRESIMIGVSSQWQEVIE